MRPNNKYAVQMDYTPLWVRVVVGVFCFVLALFSFLNVYIIVNGFLKEHGLPSGFGLTPIVVVPNEEGEQITDVVEPGDFLLILEKDIQNYKQGEAVAFLLNDTVLIGRISGQDALVDDKPTYSVRAVFLEQSYAVSATEKNMLGTIAVQIPTVGYFVLFLTSLLGRLIFVGIPFLVYVILLLIEYIRLRQTEDNLGKEKGNIIQVYTNAMQDGKAVLAAPWIWLMTAMMTWGAIGYGTAEKRRDARAEKKRAVELALACEPELKLPSLGAHDLPVCRPVRMRSTRAIRPQARRAVKAIKPLRPRNVQYPF